MAYLSLYSVLRGNERIFALVPEAPCNAIARLKKDDPVWGNLSLFQHWSMELKPQETHCVPHNKIRFWVA